MNVVTIVVTVVVAGLAALGAIWIAARPSRDGTLARAWGQLDDDEARDEIESVFPRATHAVDPAVGNVRHGGARPNNESRE
jgi:hypothetical protein